MARQTTAPASSAGISPASRNGSRRCRAAGVLFAMLGLVFGVVSPGPAVAVLAVPPVSASASAEDHGRSQADAGETVLVSEEATRGQFLRDAGAERHAAHPGGAALCGSAYVPRPRQGVRPLPAAPVVAAEYLRAECRLGRSPPPPSGI